MYTHFFGDRDMVHQAGNTEAHVLFPILHAAEPREAGIPPRIATLIDSLTKFLFEEAFEAARLKTDRPKNNWGEGGGEAPL